MTYFAGLPCPDCGRKAIETIRLTDPTGKHQHTWYVCTNWPDPLGGLRCGWTGWSIPGWNDPSLDRTPDPEPELSVSERLLIALAHVHVESQDTGWYVEGSVERYAKASSEVGALLREIEGGS